MTASIASDLLGLGLTSDEARCYITLLRRGRLTARQLCTATRISRGRIYDVVGGLLSKGVALETAGTVRSFEALSAFVAMNNLFERRRVDIDELEERVRRLVQSLSGMAAEPGGPPLQIEWLRHKATVRERCGELEDAATSEVLFCIRAPVRQGGDSEHEERALARGVRFRALYESALLKDANLGRIRSYVEAGLEVRHLPSLPTRLQVFDRAVTMLPLDEAASDPTNFTVLVIRHPGVSNLAALAFERLWEQAERVTAVTRPSRSA